MKLALLFGLFVVAAVNARLSGPGPEQDAAAPVLVELFTSEGCSSCPPAERYLNEIANNPVREGIRLVPVAYHVDYWDRLGWKDRFSQAEFTKRQQEYRRAFGDETVYTPQLVVGGREGFTGSDRKTAEKVFRSAANGEKALALPVTVVRQGGQAQITLTLPEELDQEEGDRLYLVWTQGSLKTAVAKGENKGKTLEHEAVALAMTEHPVQAQVTLPEPAAAGSSKPRLVAFIQNRDDKRVKAVGVGE